MRTIAVCGPATVAICLALVLPGCSGGQPTTPSPTAPTTSSAATSAETPTGSVEPSAATPSESPDERDYTPPPPDGSPDPSSAGSLSASSFPKSVLGFTPLVTEPEEGETDPNGEFVQAVDGDQAGRESRAGCTTDADGTWPTPRHALQASYAKNGAPGGGMALQFADDAAAESWYRHYTEDLAGCRRSDDGSGLATLQFRQGSGWMVSRRLIDGERWSELTKRSGNIVLLLMVSDQNATSMNRLEAVARKLPAKS